MLSKLVEFQQLHRQETTQAGLCSEDAVLAGGSPASLSWVALHSVLSAPCGVAFCHLCSVLESSFTPKH